MEVWLTLNNLSVLRRKRNRVCWIMASLNIIIATLNINVPECASKLLKRRDEVASLLLTGEDGLPRAKIPYTKQGYCLSSGEDRPSVLIPYRNTHATSLSIRIHSQKKKIILSLLLQCLGSKHISTFGTLRNLRITYSASKINHSSWQLT